MTGCAWRSIRAGDSPKQLIASRRLRASRGFHKHLAKNELMEFSIIYIMRILTLSPAIVVVPADSGVAGQ